MFNYVGGPIFSSHSLTLRGINSIDSECYWCSSGLSRRNKCRSPPSQNHIKCIHYYYCRFWCFCNPQQNHTLTNSRTSSVNTSERRAGRFVYAASADESVESTHLPAGSEPKPVRQQAERQSIKCSPVYTFWAEVSASKFYSARRAWLEFELCLLLSCWVAEWEKKSRKIWMRIQSLMVQNRDERCSWILRWNDSGVCMIESEWFFMQENGQKKRRR